MWQFCSIWLYLHYLQVDSWHLEMDRRNLLQKKNGKWMQNAAGCWILIRIQLFVICSRLTLWFDVHLSYFHMVLACIDWKKRTWITSTKREIKYEDWLFSETLGELRCQKDVMSDRCYVKSLFKKLNWMIQCGSWRFRTVSFRISLLYGD